jgi:hypothetical protein
MHEFTQHPGCRTLGMRDGAFTIEPALEPRHMSRV